MGSQRPEPDGTASGSDAAGSHGIGASPTRREDPALITGEAEYVDDRIDAELLHAAVVRSRYGHARIEAIETAEAASRPEVVAVYTAEDVAASGVSGRIRVSGDLPEQKATDFPMLAGGKVRYGGEAIAVVLAEERYAAHSAADAVSVEYDRLDAVTDVEAALADDAPTLHEEYDDNLAFDWEFDEGDVDAAVADADHTVEMDIDNPRVIPNAMEPRGTVAEYDPDAAQLTMWMSTQAPHRAREKMAEMVGLPEERLRVIAPDVGGGFGSKGGAPYHEEPLAAWCAVQEERPVKWIATRTESHRTDHHGRGIHARGELALDADGRIRGLRVDGTVDLGAYLVWGNTPALNFRHLLSCQYEIPAIGGHVRGAFTNTTPVAPYRGAGRPESVYVTERLLDRAAAELDIDPAELRRRNLVPPDAFPFETKTGAVYDSGNYERALDEALDAVDYEEWRERQEQLREEGRYVGVGLGSFVENTGTGPGLPGTARVELRQSGDVVAYCGTHDHGQGHGTSFSQLLSDELGVDYDDVELHEGDTADLPTGTGTFGSRSAAVGGSVLAEAAGTVRERARRLAARHLEAAPEDVAFDDGEFHVAGAPTRSVDIQQVARRSYEAEDLPEELSGGLAAMESYDPENQAYAFGTHVAVVEVDPASGELEFHDYVAVDDCGVQFNPMIVEGQVHGGVVQGIGQALYERAVYDDTGTLVSGSLQDYAMPKAEQVPEMEVHETVTPCPHNPVGAKGVGESGTMGAPPAVVNAAVDALSPLGVDNLQMPLTAETLWAAVRDGDQ
jgi:carbon-monoxide dehydrogenase large subunit